MSETVTCGHPESLIVTSVESDYQFCELCEARSERDDALTMEAHLGARVRLLQEALKPFSDFAGELFARNYNRRDRLVSIGAADLHLTVGDFFDARAALAKATVSQDARTPQETDKVES